MGEGVEVDVPHLLEQFGEPAGGIDLGAQDEGIDEHADQRVEHGLTAPGDRCGHRDVGGITEPGHQHRERRVYHHERGGAQISCDRVDPVAHIGGYRELDPATGHRRHRWPRTGRGKLQDVGQTGELAAPVLELTPDHRVLVGSGAEHVVLPDGEVGELHRQRREFGYMSLRTGRVRRHEVSEQRMQ